MPRPAKSPTSTASRIGMPRILRSKAVTTISASEPRAYWPSVQLLPVCCSRALSKAGFGISRWARPSMRFWVRCASRRLSWACAATSVDLLCRSRTASRRRDCALPVEGAAIPKAPKTTAPKTPIASKRIGRLSTSCSSSSCVGAALRSGSRLGLGGLRRLGEQSLEIQLVHQRHRRLGVLERPALRRVDRRDGVLDELRQRLGQLCSGRDLRKGLAELGGLDRDLRIERDGNVDLALDRLLEILAGDLLLGRADAVRDDDNLRLGRVALEPGQDADRIAGRGERILDDDDRDVH